MDKLLNNKLKPQLIALIQAIAVVVYVALVAAFLFLVEKSRVQPGYLGIVFMLTLLVFSAGISGSLVFGLPVYYALNNKISRAISILLYTFLFILLILVLIFLIIFATTR